MKPLVIIQLNMFIFCAGIGKICALDMAKRGGKIIMLCRSTERGEAAAEEIRWVISFACLFRSEEWLIIFGKYFHFKNNQSFFICIFIWPSVRLFKCFRASWPFPILNFIFKIFLGEDNLPKNSLKHSQDLLEASL